MYNLIRFIQKHHFVILFLVLEVLCIVMLTLTQGFHRQRRINTTNDIVGKIYETGTNVGDYFRLGNNYIMIDKGRADGIEKDMGVISTEGIVGIVADVSAHYASVMSLLHSYSTISVRFKESGQLANLRWETSNYRYGIVEDIPTHLTLSKGDTLVTSSYSYIFPENLIAGTVEEPLKSSTGALNRAKVRFATDFSSLKNVYVIHHTNKAELDSLFNNQPKL